MIIDINAAIKGRKLTEQFAIIIPTDVTITHDGLEDGIMDFKRENPEALKDLTEEEIEEAVLEKLMKDAKFPMMLDLEHLLDTLRFNVAWREHPEWDAPDYRLSSVPTEISDHQLMDVVKDFIYDTSVQYGFVVEAFDLRIHNWRNVIKNGRGEADACLHSEDYDWVD